MWLTLCVLLGSLSLSLAQRQWMPFNCLRLNSDCADGIGICNSRVGQCDCNGTNPPMPGYQGFDCSLFTDDILPDAACSPRCKNGGTCFNDNARPACYCIANFTDADCSQRRVDVECGLNYISLYIKPHRDGSFAGLIAVTEELPFDTERILTHPACSREGIADRLPDNSYVITFALDSSSPCFQAVQIRNLSNGNTEYTVNVRVLYRATIITTSDETHTFKCIHTASGVTGGVLVGDQIPDLGGATVTSSIQVTQMDFLLRSGPTVISPINGTTVVFVGQELFTRVSLKPNAQYASLVVESCEVRPTEEENLAARTLFFVNRCPSARALSIVDNVVGSVRVDNATVQIAIYAIKYTSADTIYVSCDVTLCRDSDDPRCAPSNCSEQVGGPFSGFGRRKRDADELGSESVTQPLIVLGSRQQLEAIRGGQIQQEYIYLTTEQPCTENPLFIVVAAVCGVLLVTALVVLVVFCRRRSCGRSKMLLQ